MTVNKLRTGLTKVFAGITLVVMVAPLFPTAAFAQASSTGSDTGTTPITPPSDTPAPSDSASGLPAPSGINFTVNPNGSSPSVSPDNDNDSVLLVQSIRTSIDHNQPEQALDRLHTFVVKYIRQLCTRHAIPFNQDIHLFIVCLVFM